ncbi:hypothetical protein [Novosphingobium sp.]|uniref:hypothetical protein n=1 Tax=Novosphingobium sp. TaxID=1874826 RepID=UPI0025D56181|nr:hypothetical protein [Novosphingobium sp.]
MEEREFLAESTALIEFALARNDFLDHFADVEGAICKILQKNGTPQINKEPFGNRLKAFREVQNTTLVAKCRISQRNQLADSLAKILPLRADIVHSRMHIAQLDGMPVALFVNSLLTHDPDAPARILSLQRIKQLSAKLVNHAKTLDLLRKPINPASSPPPPSPGVAVGP